MMIFFLSEQQRTLKKMSCIGFPTLKSENFWTPLCGRAKKAKNSFCFDNVFRQHSQSCDPAFSDRRDMLKTCSSISFRWFTTATSDNVKKRHFHRKSQPKNINWLCLICGCRLLYDGWTHSYILPKKIFSRYAEKFIHLINFRHRLQH